MPDLSGPVIVWFRRDLRLADNAALTAAARSGRAVIPVFLLDETASCLGAAPRWRLGQGVAALARALEARGLRLILRRGRALDSLRALIAETGAGAVFWTRGYDPAAIARDRDVKAALRADGYDVQSFPGHVLFEPWTVQTGTGGFYRVYTPFWKAVRNREVVPLLPAPPRLRGPDDWPGSDDLAAWSLAAGMNRGAEIVARHAIVGEAAAADRLDAFLDDRVAGYAHRRDFPAAGATSGLSENLAWGEIGVARCWHAGLRARDAGAEGAEMFLKELVWREFAYHLIFHTPDIVSQNWRRDWDDFPWSADSGTPAAVAWMRARTGMPLVDAGLREMYVSGRMHNRVRMLVASYLTKHLMTHWRIGMDHFADCLTDWDPASNALGWQWVAGSGPDAAPFFRIFNPEAQARRFDAAGDYVRRWIAEGSARPHADALSYFDAVPRRWNLRPDDPYPAPVVAADAGRRVALEAYRARRATAT